ncbi:hypothetical protein IEO21_00422 [Rhodonia placenta]|uniref:Aminopeptidase n=1 Tax=Rhodonia placenta TaxID=104341 RepID=A0A8H7PB85_9APHY|nr:hypothetical protein IEO21_00422 [Postia placenta]
MSSDAQVDYRLPTDVKPTHYDLVIRTDLKQSKFDGVVKVHLDVLKETSRIVFNVNELKLDAVYLYPDANLSSPLAPSSTDFDKTMERTTLHFDAPLVAGSKAQLQIAFEGELTDSMMAYYKSAGGEDQSDIYALTQFEPTAARRAFPCWDEPLLKATYAVTLISRADTVNLSNMSVASESAYEPESADKTDGAVFWPAEQLSKLAVDETSGSDKWKITRFETSPPMSTYLVAWANGKFAHLESSYVSPLSGKTRPLRIYATHDLIHQAQFALDVKRQVLPLYEKVFDIEYPLPKLDTLVAHDYDSGAMENWGLIIGCTSALLLDPNSTKLESKKDVAATQAHEVAHMWFGDITTMAWWDNLYLNEGEIFPEWKLHSAFISESLSWAMDLDAKLSSHPIEVECPDAEMVNQIFDDLSYSKAASVLRMLSNYVGEERFLKGVSIYLKKHLFANSVTKDLWEGIGAATGIDIPKMMDNWVKTVGYPVVKVTETREGVHIRQDRFLETGPAKPEDNETLWTIPLALLTTKANGETVLQSDIVLDEREKTIPLDVTRPFKLNAGTVSFYRVLYTPERLLKIAKEAVKTPSPFSVEDRMGLVYDAMALSKAGYSEVSSALALVDILRDEPEHLVWTSIQSNLALLRSVWYDYPDVRASLAQFSQELYGPIVRQLGYEYTDDEPSATRELRTLAISTAATAGEPSVVKELTGRFAHYMKTGDDSRIPADLQRAIYTISVREGGRAEWEAVKGIAKKPKNPSAGTDAMVGMGYSLDLAQETFDFMLTEARAQDMMPFIGGMANNPAMRRFLAQAFKDNFATIDKRLEGNYTMQTLVTYAFESLTTDKDYDDTVVFFKEKDTSRYDLALKQTLDSIASRSAWIKRSTTDVQQWFETRKSNRKL